MSEKGETDRLLFSDRKQREHKQICSWVDDEIDKPGKLAVGFDALVNEGLHLVNVFPPENFGFFFL